MISVIFAATVFYNVGDDIWFHSECPATVIIAQDTNALVALRCGNMAAPRPPLAKYFTVFESLTYDKGETDFELEPGFWGCALHSYEPGVQMTVEVFEICDGDKYER